MNKYPSSVRTFNKPPRLFALVAGAVLVSGSVSACDPVHGAKPSTDSVSFNPNDTSVSFDGSTVVIEMPTVAAGTNVRYEPLVSDTSDGSSNVCTTLENDLVLTNSFINHYLDKNDPNGGWSAVDPANSPELSECLDDPNGEVWVSDQYTSLEK